jgi:hypothetical protein
LGGGTGEYTGVRRAGSEGRNGIRCNSREASLYAGIPCLAERVIFEPIFLATVKGSTALDANHIDTDPDGSVGEARWFTRQELAQAEVYPQAFKERFCDEIEGMMEGKDRFLGVRGVEHA